MSFLEGRIRTEAGKAGKIIVAYGATKIGKTTTFVQAPNVLLIEAKDKSSDVLKESGQMDRGVQVVQTTDWQDSLSVLTSIAEEEHDRKTIVIDGGSGLNEYCDEYTINNSCSGSVVDFSAFGRGDKLASFEWANLLNILDRIKDRGLMVFLLCHQGTVTIKNPLGDDFLKATPQLSKDKLAMTVKYADAILFMHSVIAQSNVDKQTHVGKAQGGEVRVMRTKPSAAYEAGNRMNLVDPIMLGNSHKEAFGAFFNAVREGRKVAA